MVFVQLLQKSNSRTGLNQSLGVSGAAGSVSLSAAFILVGMKQDPGLKVDSFGEMKSSLGFSH